MQNGGIENDMNYRITRRRAPSVPRSRFAVMLLLVLLSVAVVLLTLFLRQAIQSAYSAPASNEPTVQAIQASCGQSSAYRYYTLKQASGFVLARAERGSLGQPIRLPQTVASFGNDFGQAESDQVFRMQLSPDGCYLAIAATEDHGDLAWVYDIQRGTLSPAPANVMGDFLNWLPGGTGHSFLYRPMLPLGPDAPRVNNAWNPGLWIVNAATGAFTNLDIGAPSAMLVDAAPSPDGSRIVYSTSLGLGMGSDVWMMRGDGSQVTHLFRLPGGAQSIAGLFAWSPDGSQIAYERLSDSPVPFLPAGLWVMSSSGTHSRYLAETDGGHGYSLAWSPDSARIAYIVRTNDSDRAADYSAQALQSAIAVVDVRSGASALVATAASTGMQLNLNPEWMTNATNAPGSTRLLFTASNPFNLVLGGSPRYWSAQVAEIPASRAQSQSLPEPLTPALSHVVAVGE